MRKMTAWILGGVAALTVTGLAFALPALAEDKAPGYNMMKSGDMATMHNVMMPLMSQMPAMHQAVMGEVATQLGISPDELNQAMKDGKSLATLADEKGVAIGEIRATMTNGMKTFLDKLVADKTITQEQAGQMLGFMEKNMEACLTGQMGSMMGGSDGSQGCH